MPRETAGGRTRFPHLSPEAIVFPADKVALGNLQKLPFLPHLVAKFNEHAIDRVYYAHNAAESLLCSSKQFPTLYGLLREACDILHLDRPELYLRYSYHHNAFTAGVKRTFIVLNSSLLDGFTDEELLFIIGHELGHIKCGHMLYIMLAQLLLNASLHTPLGLNRLATKGLIGGFFEWLRQAEFTCDRAGLLTCQNPDVAFKALMKLGGGSTRFNEEMNVEAFLKQARQNIETGGEKVTKTLLFWLYNWTRDHPQIVYRAKRLEEWIKSGAYDRIMAGEYPKTTGTPVHAK